MALTCLIMVALGPSDAFAQLPVQDPAWYEREAQNYAAAFGRVNDQLSNPEYLRLLAEQSISPEQSNSSLGDPYRDPKLWKPRGRVEAVGYDNRYEFPISAHLWLPPEGYVDPVTGRPDPGPYPAVIFINGYGEVEETYWGFAQDLAEHGYVVFTWDPQGVGGSKDAPQNWKSKYCKEDGKEDDAWWWQPQEMGIQEQGQCAGENDLSPVQDAGTLMEFLATAVVGGHTGEQETYNLEAAYKQLEPTFIFGAFDAYRYLASSKRDLIDFNRVATMGHSLGSYAAAMVANGDPAHRFAAAVAMDGYEPFRHGVMPTVPTLYLQSEHEALAGPRAAPPPRTGVYPTESDYNSFVTAEISSMVVVLRASSHYDFGYTAPGGPAASSYGQRYATYFALAWLDRHIGKTGQHHKAGLHRLTAERADDSVDVSSIGAGRWDPATQQNKPYMIQGTALADMVSYYYLSRYWLPSRQCEDMLAGCSKTQ